MPLEIEIKMKVKSHAEVLSRLGQLRAKHLEAVHETNIFFDRPDGSLRQADSGLRVRLTTSEDDRTPKALLTYKGPAGSSGLHSREAFDLNVAPHDQVIPLLEALGFVRQYWFEKKRDSWLLGAAGQGECRVELDTLPVFGLFIEIEGPSEEAVHVVQQALGLGDVPQHPDSYAKMVGQYVKQQGVQALRFG